MRFGARARLGRYEILCAVAAGGMAEVYRALDTRLGRVVALKVLSRAVTADEIRRGQLESEARAASAINHPHICTLFDIDSDGGVPFLVMEYLAGETLAQRLQRGALSIDDCLRHGIQLTQAVAAVHEAGIVHRDLKPANVMLTASGVKLLDFGIAALTPSADELSTSRGVEEILGTVPYMAPEQLRGERPACAADVYAIGAILFEAATGTRPFVENRLKPLMTAILETAPPLAGDIRSGVPATLDRIIRRCLAKDPGDRCASAVDLLADLRRVRAHGARHRPKGRGAVSKPAMASLAVRPFASTTSGNEGDFLSEGITELLIAALARLASIRVISRTSVAWLDREHSLREIASRLQVDRVVNGTVGLTDEHIRVTAQMVDVPSDTQLWSATFERHLSDILSVQADLAEAIARGIQVSLTAEERAIVRGDSRQDADAHLLYLRGRFHWNHPTAEGFDESHELFKRAIEADPGYAPAYAGLADWYHRAWFERLVPAGHALAAARRYAMQALSLDSRSAEAHASMATSAMFDWDFRTAHAGFERAVALSPSYAAAHLWYARLKMSMGHFESALEEIALAHACDPLSPAVLIASGVIHLSAGRSSEANSDFRHAIELQEDCGAAYYGSGLALLQRGEYQQSEEALSTACRLRPNHPSAVAGLAICRAQRGDVAGARALEERVRQLAADQASPLSLAELYVHLAEHTRALEYLEQAYREHQAELVGLAVDPLFMPLRSYPEFQDLLRRIGLPRTPDSTTENEGKRQEL
jgi:serine/threonine-protein kinase